MAGRTPIFGTKAAKS
jgi:hypothetical protein